jgi:SpoVK/Ycf46/Vps4 family AAA+-type ATPase
MWRGAAKKSQKLLGNCPALPTLHALHMRKYTLHSLASYESVERSHLVQGFGDAAPFGTVVVALAPLSAHVCVSHGPTRGASASAAQRVRLGSGCTLPHSALPADLLAALRAAPSAAAAPGALPLLALRGSELPASRSVALHSAQLQALAPAARATALPLLARLLDGWCLAPGCQLQLPWGASGREVLQATVAAAAPGQGLQRFVWGATLLTAAGAATPAPGPAAAAAAAAAALGSSGAGSSPPTSPWKAGPALHYSSPSSSTHRSPAKAAPSPAPSPAAALSPPPLATPLAPPPPPPPPVPPCPLPGLQAAWAQLWECLVWPAAAPGHFAALASPACSSPSSPPRATPRGILLHGPSGTGKTALVAALAAAAAPAILSACGRPLCLTTLTSASGSALLSSSTPGEAEAALTALFAAGASAPASLLFLDDLDAAFPARTAQGGGLQARLTALLLTLMDGAAGAGGGRHLLLVGATRRPHALDAALRRPGRFERELPLAPPPAPTRAAILQQLLEGLGQQQGLHQHPQLPVDPALCSPHTLQSLSQECVGFVGADLAALVQRAAGCAAADAELGCTALTLAHMRQALQGSQGASSLRSSEFAGFTTSAVGGAAAAAAAGAGAGAGAAGAAASPWAGIGGCAALIARLQARVVAPFSASPLAQRLQLPPPKGVLLHGPPGNSKTTLARALARALGATFFSLSGGELLSCYVGEAEARVRALFALARAAQPAVVFFDELDALVGMRGIGSSGAGAGGGGATLLATLLTEMDGVVGWQGVLLVGATNRLAALDPALLRAGRLELHLLVPQPSAAGREDILRVHMGAMPCFRGGRGLPEQLLARLSSATEGYSGAQLQDLTRRAAVLALREHVAAGRGGGEGVDSTVTEQHFEQALLG